MHIESNGYVNNTPRRILQLEGGAMLAAAATAYGLSSGNWWLFAALFLVPDIAMLGYLVDRRIGAVSYNVVHTYVVPAALAAFGLAWGQPLVIEIAIIWLAHIGFDRLVGYGLKYPTAFGDTHLGTTGK